MQSVSRSTSETGPLDDGHLDAAKRMTNELNADGFRVVAVAYNEMAPAKTTYSVADEADLTLMGYIAFLDPPKESAAQAIAALAATGVRVKILTGDNEVVTRKICREVGSRRRTTFVLGARNRGDERRRAGRSRRAHDRLRQADAGRRRSE